MAKSFGIAIKIYSYWNVKKNPVHDGDGVSPIKIYSYWNVKGKDGKDGRTSYILKSTHTEM